MCVYGVCVVCVVCMVFRGLMVLCVSSSLSLKVHRTVSKAR